ncbi:Wadjet anti-phage system protein JetD domain-containing protein [Alteromonas sp. a30]|uniref:Wadjet anti-phage system protein JetD domain-containing protein n=1 Tax=Alteromonas sp. a30 TaxID=2730917 RepID=UPI00227E180D|nr:Wadjet anti-phage system protein JetD domain-containing protein [Alteromonas sp. a30]MCY7296236.1 hypothetical protein [Alteromonas sp. a30]
MSESAEMTEKGYEACDNTIKKMIKRVANRLFKTGDLEAVMKLAPVSIPATKNSLPEYFNLEKSTMREAYHARLKRFINVGCVEAEWDRLAGVNGQLMRITLTNPDAAATTLALVTPWTGTMKAIELLAPFIDNRIPAVEQTIEQWRQGKTFAGASYENAQKVSDAASVIKHCLDTDTSKKDILLRRLSIQLFNDSKRIEALGSQINRLMGMDNLVESDNVFAELGLVKHPQPMLISGSPDILLTTTGGKTNLIFPYSGLRPDRLISIDSSRQKINCILTIENLASFNEAAEHETNPHDLLIIYIAGNPTPSLLSAYERIIESVNPKVLMHWGDIDLGGFMIARRLAMSARNHEHRLQLVCMDPSKALHSHSVEATERKTHLIGEICHEFGWNEEAAGLTLHPFFQEQEIIEWTPKLLELERRKS